ncbi:hypothetical protein [Sphaerimonospora thailandensis]|uniref:PknH-like protein n=1 Tax=Sphaerimonospora thailandensis TaxID=795644 RepID=A0A8J3VZR1_9ACTN|nr:hypothetical protein [Sphaerimonospora thailandensis]GIH70727.1 hypothetical protein Mth01_29800 [Sphaerimonospora thailandensis]
MIIKRSVLAAGLTGLLGAALLVSASPALAGSPPKPPTPAQLRSALLQPEDLGDDFEHNTIRNRELLSPRLAHTKACVKAMKGVKPLTRSKVATWLAREEAPEGVNEYVVSGTSAQISALERAAKVMVRDCGHVNAGTKEIKQTIRKLSVGKLGDGAYGIRFRNVIPSVNPDPSMAVDIVIIRVKNTMITLEHNGFYGKFDADLTRTAAEIATTRLQEILDGSTSSAEHSVVV